MSTLPLSPFAASPGVRSLPRPGFQAAPAVRFGSDPAGKETPDQAARKKKRLTGWVERRISQPLAESVGSKLRLGKRGVAMLSSGVTLLIITALHAPLVPIIHNASVNHYRDSVDTYGEVQELLDAVSGNTLEDVRISRDEQGRYIIERLDSGDTLEIAPPPEATPEATATPAP